MQNSASPLAAIGSQRSFMRVVAEVLDRARRTVEDELGEDRARHVGAGELLEHDRGLDVAEPGAAPPLADRDAEQVGLAHAVPRPLRELFGLVAVAGHRRELALGDVAGELRAARPGPRCRRTDSPRSRAQPCARGYCRA